MTDQEPTDRWPASQIVSRVNVADNPSPHGDTIVVWITGINERTQQFMLTPEQAATLGDMLHICAERLDGDDDTPTQVQRDRG